VLSSNFEQRYWNLGSTAPSEYCAVRSGRAADPVHYSGADAEGICDCQADLDASVFRARCGTVRRCERVVTTRTSKPQPPPSTTEALSMAYTPAEYRAPPLPKPPSASNPHRMSSDCDPVMLPGTIPATFERNPPPAAVSEIWRNTIIPTRRISPQTKTNFIKS
jgi:hypothetical protein